MHQHCTATTHFHTGQEHVEMDGQAVNMLQKEKSHLFLSSSSTFHLVTWKNLNIFLQLQLISSRMATLYPSIARFPFCKSGSGWRAFGMWKLLTHFMNHSLICTIRSTLKRERELSHSLSLIQASICKAKVTWIVYHQRNVCFESWLLK